MVRLVVPSVLFSLLAGCGSGTEAPDARIPSYSRPDANEPEEEEEEEEEPPPGFEYDAQVGKAQIDDIRAAKPGEALELPLSNVRVTFVKPVIDDDAGGFFVQADGESAALFVAWVPGEDEKRVSVGDIVELQVNEVGTAGGGAMFAATRVSDVTVIDSGSDEDIADFIHDANAETFSDDGAALEGRVVALIDTINTPNGTLQRHVSAPLDGSDARLRVPAEFADRYDLAKGCAVQVKRGVVWRHKTQSGSSPTPYVIAYDEREVHAAACPRPRVTAAFSLSAESVAVQFDRRMDKVSLAPAKFAISGLAVTNAVVDPKNPRVVLLTTANQSQTGYSVTVDGTVADVFGAQVYGSPSERTVAFDGNEPYAKLALTEIAPNISSSRDQVELVALTGGTLYGLALDDGFHAATRLAKLKKVRVAAGDLVVIHLKPDTSKVSEETTSKTQGTKANNHDDAWDVFGYAEGVTFTDRVLVVRHDAAGPIDAVPFSNTSASVTARPSVFPYDFTQALQSKLWATECAGDTSKCGAAEARAASVEWNSVGTTPGGNTVHRKAAANLQSRDNWLLGASTLGGANP
jgi:hypothetical protein